MWVGLHWNCTIFFLIKVYVGWVALKLHRLLFINKATEQYPWHTHCVIRSSQSTSHRVHLISNVRCNVRCNFRQVAECIKPRNITQDITRNITYASPYTFYTEYLKSLFLFTILLSERETHNNKKVSGGWKTVFSKKVSGVGNFFSKKKWVGLENFFKKKIWGGQKIFFKKKRGGGWKNFKILFFFFFSKKKKN